MTSHEDARDALVTLCIALVIAFACAAMLIGCGEIEPLPFPDPDHLLPGAPQCLADSACDGPEVCREGYCFLPCASWDDSECPDGYYCGELVGGYYDPLCIPLHCVGVDRC